MTRDEFCKYHWEYFLVLENDFLQIERYVTFDLGDDFLYTDHETTNSENGKCFSNEFIKQYQAICSEVDVILKSICKEIDNSDERRTMIQYTAPILGLWPEIVQQKVKMKDMLLQPLSNWSVCPEYQSPHWWTPYNDVKHNRIANYKKANLKNTLNALAGLYILEQYLVKYIGERDKTMDVPNDISKIFEMVDYKTRNIVIGKNNYLATEEDIDQIFAN